jgi:hypothetical protein
MLENRGWSTGDMPGALLKLKYPCHVGDVTSVFDPTKTELESNFECGRHASLFMRKY